MTVGELVSSYELWNLQYATLTDLAADDFATTPGLAESWSSEDGKKWTYVLREGLEWSDGTPLTAEDIEYTINRSREEEWLNHTSTVQNLTAEATDERTVVVTSSVNDPKLPGLSAYIVPKHVYEKIPADEITKYEALDGVASGAVLPGGVEEGPVLADDGEPELLARPGRDRRGRLPRLPEPGRDGRRAAERRARRRAQRAGGDLPAARDRRGHRRGRGRAGQLRLPRPEQLRGQASARHVEVRRAASRRCATSASARRSPTRSTRRPSSSACCRGSARRGRR